MKRSILTFVLMAFFCSFIGAQQKVVIKLTDGSTIEKEVWEIENISFIESTPMPSPTVAHAIDLGLSVQWANCNFGALSENEPGLLIGWGDYTGTNHSTNNDYFPMANPQSNITGTRYDIVHSMWGDLWRMPTTEEVKELIEGCDWAYDEANKGYRITSKTNSSASIFIPFTGKREGQNEVIDLDKGFYWTGDLSATVNSNAGALSLDNLEYKTSEFVRYLGCAIRPVYGAYVYGCTVNSAKCTSTTPKEAYITAQYANDYEHATEFGVCYSSSESELNPETGTCVKETTVETNGEAQFAITGLTPNTTYYYAAYVLYNGKYNLGETKQFTTQPKFPVAEAVDLGLSVKWAAWNMGASKINDYGSYIAWGDPTGEDRSFSDTHYPNDLSDIAGTKYDVAHIQWGGKWRMPTTKELEELAALEKHIVTRDGVTGLEITGKNNNTLFLPMGGFEKSTGFSRINDYAYYWASQNSTMDYAYYTTVGVVSGTSSPTNKGLHMLIRPVESIEVVDPNATLTDAGKAAKSVDLGLSVEWATYNMGATASTGYGDYYSWGETAPKDSYSESDYSHCVDGEYTNIGLDIKGTEYDAAHVLWGGTWRMPTEDEFAELISSCTWTWSADLGGYTVTGKNGNSIFLPAAGNKNGDNYSYKETQGDYWTSNWNYLPVYANDHYSNSLSITKSNHYVRGIYQYMGLSIRAVRP